MGTRLSRALLIVAALFSAWPTPANAQGTPMPFVRQQFFTNTGDVCASCELNSYAAGTTTRQDTFTNITLTTAAANPIILDSAGRPASTIYLSATSYRFVLTNSGGGTTYWDADNTPAIPATTLNVDITATAGEAMAAGEAVWLSEGSGSTTAGRWYRTDSDNTYSSTTAGMVGIAPAAIASGITSTVRLTGRVTGLSGLTAGSKYYAGATAGALTATPPTNARFLGEAESTTVLVLQGNAGALRLPDSDGTHSLIVRTSSDLTADRILTLAPGDAARTVTLSGNLTVSADSTINQNVSTTAGPSFNQFRPPQGRCTLTTATPVTTADVTAATTLYYALYGGNQITLYDGSARWVYLSFTELSLSVPATTNTMYDVFVDYTAGVPVLEAVAWTNDTTRATALALQNGVYVQTSDTDSLYVCSFRTTGVSGQTEDSMARRLVWNYFNRVPRVLRRLESTATWTYTTATVRQANGSTANQVDVVVGVAEVRLRLTLAAASVNTTNTTRRHVGIGEDSTTTYLATALSWDQNQDGMAANEVSHHIVMLDHSPAIGRHFYSWNEKSAAAGTTTWRGVIGADGSSDIAAQSGLSGEIDG